MPVHLHGLSLPPRAAAGDCDHGWCDASAYEAVLAEDAAHRRGEPSGLGNLSSPSEPSS